MHDEQSQGCAFTGATHLDRRVNVTVSDEEVISVGQTGPHIGGADGGIVGVEVLLHVHENTPWYLIA